MEKTLSFQDVSLKLLDWYDANKRELPWRASPSLYRTVVSEFMLQQTQVKTMLPYFDRWMAVFPDFETLSKSDESTVVRLWEGLGYYRRARNLRLLAIQWVEAEVKPTSFEAWIGYPGVGPYIAAAISSISFNEPKVVVDGNVIRVVSRLQNIDDTFKSSSVATNRIRPVAQQYISTDRPGDFNQALMELGATICRPQGPQCLLCPVRDYCEACKLGVAENLPVIKKTKIEKITIPRILVIDQDLKRILLQEGGMEGRLDGIYELPHLNGEPKENWKAIAAIKRGISNQMIHEPIFELSVSNYKEYIVQKITEPEWIPLKNLEMVSLSGPHRKWISDFLSSDEGSC